MDIRKGPKSPEMPTRQSLSQLRAMPDAQETVVLTLESLELRKERLKKIQDELEILQFRLGPPRSETFEAAPSSIADCFRDDVCVKFVGTSARLLAGWVRRLLA